MKEPLQQHQEERPTACRENSKWKGKNPNPSINGVSHWKRQLPRGAIAEQLAEGLFVPGDAVAGDQVEVLFGTDDGDEYFPGTVTRASAKSIRIKFDDDYKETFVRTKWWRIRPLDD